MEKIRKKLFEIIFEADTYAGKTFDVILLFIILLSTVIVIIESVPSINQVLNKELRIIEWTVTILFTIEYILRIYSVKKPSGYIFSFFGIIDLMAILPSYLGFFFAGPHSLLIIRTLRLLRVFRVFKISRYLEESKFLIRALYASRIKISVFLFALVTLMLIIGTLMYLIEGENSDFTSIPKSIYWAIVTMTTVGYGDITPHTAVGQFLSGVVMILGYSIIAVPTGIVGFEMANSIKKAQNTQVCPNCAREGHDSDAVYCKYCGSLLNET
ncbi:MAG: ion transporter [Bacteroidales bacterium]|nr:ion transporter [Bacteroidales bacterium]